jgi:tetratricopeptide (TPR) repeat protein
MQRSNEPTEPRMAPVTYHNETGAPPRILLWGVVIVFVLIIVGLVGGVWAFNNILSSGQQARVITMFPFMESLQQREPTPEGGILPTSNPQVTSNALDLLNMPLNATGTPQTNTPQSATETPAPSMTATSIPLATATLPATATQESAAAPTTEVLIVSQAISAGTAPQAHRNFGFQWERQSWNNCGPATLTIALSYFGWQENQEYAKDALRPNREDKNVSPEELIQFVNLRTGVRALWRMGGTIDLLREIIAAGFPVIIERGIMFEANDWLGHYQALVAYDDVQRSFFAYDTFLGIGEAGEGITQSYQSVDEDWRAFNRSFIVIYRQEDSTRLQALLGDLWEPTGAAETALTTAMDEIRLNQSDSFAWHNAGTALAALGRYQESATAFDRARQVGLPWRMLWYQFGMLEAYYQMGRYDDVISLTQANLYQAPELEESYYWRGMSLAARGDVANAITDFRAALRYNPNFTAARTAIDQLGS